ncbi:kunitz/Bovine pancreatic trypsin inhibitor domain-containing protein [Ditylenchus destructor]|uniref:Kunitz/Bovine pancreatic trypsin inhibitor domain-containing protein n=1 Tax=Ditylenchus destructor TaxID=166010 RepID=A0AAD4R721_9BILA|nr:kunitz/Bovine pancreatic trypsin inhibitor domain-containing protein [Ditylenchus destructor]
MDMALPSSLIITELLLFTTLLPLTFGYDTYLYQNSNISTTYFHNDSLKGHEDNSFLGAIGRLIFGEESKRFLRNFTTSELPGLALSAVNSFGSHNSFESQLPTTSAVVPDNRHHYRYQSNQHNYASYPPQNLAGSPASSCTLPQAIGTGPYRIPRWYYNPSRLRCELFYWSGCCGNANNFATHQSCEQLCENVDHKQNSVVYVPFTLTFTMRPTDGPPSQQTKQIRPLLPSEPNPPNNGIENNINELISMQYKPEAVTNRERMGGNSVFPPPLSLVTNKCELDLDTGHGGPPQKRYYFNPITKLCQEFQFGGQGGNPNNFVNFILRNAISYFSLQNHLDECRRECRESPNPCAYGPVSGQPIQCQPGTVLSTTCTGQQFCHIGASPATTICCPKPALVDPCQQPLNIGIGNANLPRFYYNPPTQTCQTFAYKGLQGNENNFMQRAQCESVCQPRKKPLVITDYTTYLSESMCSREPIPKPNGNTVLLINKCLSCWILLPHWSRHKDKCVLSSTSLDYINGALT